MRRSRSTGALAAFENTLANGNARRDRRRGGRADLQHRHASDTRRGDDRQCRDRLYTLHAGSRLQRHRTASLSLRADAGRELERGDCRDQRRSRPRRSRHRSARSVIFPAGRSSASCETRPGWRRDLRRRRLRCQHSGPVHRLPTIRSGACGSSTPTRRCSGHRMAAQATLTPLPNLVTPATPRSNGITGHRRSRATAATSRARHAATCRIRANGGGARHAQRPGEPRTSARRRSRRSRHRRRRWHFG